jgi:branched-chain amino acid transport system permease protein
LFGQLLLGLINGSFYAVLSLGLAVIFGLLNIINFTHGAQYMLGAFCAYLLLNKLGIGYWPSLVIVPVLVGLTGVAIERLMLKHLYKLDHLYGLLLTFGLALIIEGLFRNAYGSSGEPFPIPRELAGGHRLGFMFLPTYRAWVIVASLVVCFSTWFVIERTKLGSYLRAATENPQLVQAFGINVPRMITLTYGFGVALAALAGVMAAPIYQVSPQMGSSLIIVVFAVVVIGGMGSIMGSIVTGFGLGIIEGLTKVFYPEASNTVIFIIMAIVLLIKPAGLFGAKRKGARRAGAAPSRACAAASPRSAGGARPGVSRRAARALPSLRDEGDVLRPVRLRFQPPDRLRRAAVLRTRHVPRHRGLRFGACRKGLGPHARARHPFRHRRRAAARARYGRAGDPPAGHLFRDDHAGARADDVLLLPAGAFHRRRRRHPGGAARAPLRRAGP